MQHINGSMNPETFATRDETMHLADCLRELSSQLMKNSTIQEGLIKRIENIDTSIKRLEKEETQMQTAWSLICNLWKKAPLICGTIFVTIALMTDGSFHISKVVSSYYKIKNGVDSGEIRTGNQDSPSA